MMVKPLFIAKIRQQNFHFDVKNIISFVLIRNVKNKAKAPATANGGFLSAIIIKKGGVTR